MFNDTLTLLPYTIERDELGNPKKIKTEKQVLCSVESATRYEFYNYGVADRRPEFVVTINKCEYGGETDCIFRGENYNISRVYEVDRDLIELTLDKEIGIIR